MIIKNSLKSMMILFDRKNSYHKMHNNKSNNKEVSKKYLKMKKKVKIIIKKVRSS